MTPEEIQPYLDQTEDLSRSPYGSTSKRNSAKAREARQQSEYANLIRTGNVNYNAPIAAVGNRFPNDSVYDEGMTIYDLDNGINTYRDKNQSGLVETGNILLHGVTSAATAFAGTAMLTNPYGLAAMGITTAIKAMENANDNNQENDNIFSWFADNAINKLLFGVSDAITSNTPVYSAAMDNEGLSKYAGTAGIDQAVSGLGFLLGGIGSSRYAASKLSQGSKFYDFLLNKAGGSKILKGATAEAAALNGIEAGQDIQKLASAKKFADGVTGLTSSLVGRVGESVIEAQGTKQEMINNGYSEEQADKALKFGFAANMALSSVDYFQNLKMLGTFKGILGTGSKATKYTDDVIDAAVRGGLGRYDKAASIAKAFGENFVWEGGEEGLQYAINKGAQETAIQKEGWLSFGKNVGKEFGNSFTTEEGQLSWILGGVLGGGVSSIITAKNFKDKKKSMAEYIAEAKALKGDLDANYKLDESSLYSTYKMPDGTTQKVINQKYIDTIANNNELETVKEYAQAKNDNALYEAAKNKQILNKALFALHTDSFDSFIGELETSRDATPEELQKLKALQDKTSLEETVVTEKDQQDHRQSVTESIRQAKEFKSLYEDALALPQLAKLSKDGMFKLFKLVSSQKALANEVKKANPLVQGAIEEYITDPDKGVNETLSILLRGIKDPIEKEKLIDEFDKYRDLALTNKNFLKEYAELMKAPQKLEEAVKKEDVAKIAAAIENLTNDLKQEGQDLANAVGQTIVVEDAEGNEVEVVVATDEDGNFVNENTGEILPNEVVLEQTAVPEEEVVEEDLPEFDEEVVTNDESNVIDEYQKKLTVNATAGQALQLDGGNYVIENGERVENPKFVEQTKIFNDPTISDNVVENPEDQPNVITFKAELGTITEAELSDTNARRKSKGLEPITMEQAQNDSDFVPIVLTLMVNGVAKNTAKSFYHNPEYYYDTVEHQMIEDSDIKKEAKDKLHAENIAKHKATRADLVQQLKDKKSVILLTAGKSRGVLNYNPKVDTERKTSNVIGILAENFKELLNGIQNKFFSIEGGKTNPINTQGLKIVTAVAKMEDGNFIIYTQSNSSKSAFVSKGEYSVGTMLMDLISPSGEVVTTSPFTKARFSYEQIKSLSELVLEKLQGRNTVDVGGTLVTISGTEKVPGILDSVMYVGKVKSSDADAINSQVYFTKDGRLVLGNKPYDKNTEGIYDIIEKHISQYKARPHFKFKSIEIFGNNFGIPVKQGNGTFKMENPVDYMEFMFGGEKTPALITTALNSTKFVNSYFKFATNNDNTLKVEGETAKAVPVITEPVSNIETKIDIEKDEQGNFIPKKYTLNARGENPAPNISVSAISDESFGGELPTDIKQVKLLEVRGKNSLGQTVGEVWIQKEDGQNYTADVIFNDAELASLEGKTEEVVEETPEEVIPTIVNETVQNCKGVSAPPEIKTTSESSNISKAADNYSWE